MTPAAKVASAIVVAGLATTSVAGCAEIERSTGIGTKGQVGTVGGATVGGLIAAAAGASPAWIAGSVILGALTGGVIGSILDDRDKEMHAQSSYNAIQNKKAGGRTAWNNPDTGSSGTTSINRVYRKADGTRCKDFTQKIQADGKTESVKGTACQQADGSWKVVA